MKRITIRRRLVQLKATMKRKRITTRLKTTMKRITNRRRLLQLKTTRKRIIITSSRCSQKQRHNRRDERCYSAEYPSVVSVEALILSLWGVL
jgi:hypothetical protein